MPGIKPSRADIILGGAIVVQAVMEVGGFEGIEVTEAGLREGVFFERHLGGDPPLFDDVRRASVVNLAAQYEMDPTHNPHIAHVARLALGALRRAGAPPGLHDGDAVERELLWAAALLHDIGMTVDYDDHHKHSRYLVLNAGLPGFEQREVALIGQAVRYHRKGMPSLGPFAPAGDKGDEERLDRMAALLRLAEDLERSRDQLVRAAHVAVDDGDGAPRPRVRRRRPRAALGRRARGRAVRARLRPSADGLTSLTASSGAAAPLGPGIPIPLEPTVTLRRSARRGGPGPTGTSSGSTGALIASTSSISSSGGSMPSQTRRNAPVPTLASPSSTRPAIVSPSSHCIRSISNGFIRTVCGGKGHLALCSAFALVIASKFLASALMGPESTPGLRMRRRGRRRPWPRAGRRRTARGAGRRTTGGDRARRRGGG